MKKTVFGLIALVLVNFIGYSQKSDEKAVNFINERYSAKVEFINKTDFNIIYKDGKSVSAKLVSDGKYYSFWN